ncbi:MAG TPA: hypothetical protein VHG29_03445 [Novosphingobium sp.]|nr:hypothetical protein [Novosphingobium sp.]
MIIDPPSLFAPETEWRAFLAGMEALALEHPQDAALVRLHIKMAKQQLAIPLDDPRFKCPQCKQRTGVNILYGYPSHEAFEQAERNETVLGGCCQPMGSPDRQCLACGHQWEIIRRGPQNSQP